MAMSPEKMMESVARNLKERTGKTLGQWVRVAKRSGLKEAKELRRWLKSEHGLGQTTCFVVCHATLEELGVATPGDDELLEAQFKGDKAALRPTYDRLVQAVKRLGKDVTVGVRKTQTTFARDHTFAIAKAPTRARILLGLRLPGTKPTRRLQASTTFSDNASHAVELTKPGDVDDALKRWLKAAYAARGK